MNIFENHKILHENRLPSRAWYIPYDTAEKALVGDRTASKFYMDLNGVWDFKYYEAYGDEGEVEVAWDKIPVPSNWQMHGYGQLAYIDDRYQFPMDPPYVPDDTPMGVYRRTFSVPALWEARKTCIVFEGVDSCMFLYVNDKYVGYSQGTHMQSEFDISGFLCEGENTLTVKVLQWCDGSYLECQDMIRMSGIFRDVYLLSRDPKGQRDFKVTANTKEITVDAEKYSIYFEGKKVEKPTLLWTAETPNIYTVIVENGDEFIPFFAGMRDVAISEKGEFLINGSPVKFRGVNYHETNPETGHTVFDFESDLVLMKELNINCIRTSHYPPHPRMLDLCDKMGFYVMDEADLETHGYKWSDMEYQGYNRHFFDKNWLCCKPDWDDAFVDRAERMYERDKNHSCIVSWSLGNESGFGRGHAKMSEFIRSKDPIRPIHYERAVIMGSPEEAVDMISVMYPPSGEDLDAFAQRLRVFEEKKPFFFCEYAHAMGNSPGGMEDYWRKIYEYDNFIGGCIWEWRDHAVLRNGVYLYGGDFGEKIHDKNFCCDGMTLPDRSLKAGTRAIAATYRGFNTEYADGILTVTNRYDFLNLDNFTLRFSVENDGETVKAWDKTVSIAPHESAVVEVELPEIATSKWGAFLTISLVDKDGKEVAFRQHKLPVATTLSKSEATDVKMEKEGRYIRITEGKNIYVFDTRHGSLVDICGTMTAPALFDVWRAPTDNETRVRFEWGVLNQGEIRTSQQYDYTRVKVYDCTAEGNAIRVTGMISANSRLPIAPFVCTYTFVKDGVEVHMSGEVSKRNPYLPRLGFTFALKADDTAFSYFAGGPWGCYSDMEQHTKVGLYESTADKEYEPYPMPQEHGNHNRARMLTVGGLRFESEKDIEINVSRYSAEMLTNAVHPDTLQKTDTMYVRVDYKCSGVGSMSCGEKLPERYRMTDGKFDLAFRIQPTTK